MFWVQSVKTRVIKNNLNPVWNEKLMLSIPDDIPPLKVVKSNIATYFHCFVNYSILFSFLITTN